MDRGLARLSWSEAGVGALLLLATWAEYVCGGTALGVLCSILLPFAAGGVYEMGACSMKEHCICRRAHRWHDGVDSSH